MFKTIKQRVIGLACMVGTLLGSAPAMAATSEQVDKAISKARDYLYSQQSKGVIPGTWETSPKRTADGSASLKGAQWGGLTAMCTYALLASGDSASSSKLKQAVSYLKNTDMIGVYALGVRAQIWGKIPVDADVRQGISRDAAQLFKGIKTTGQVRGLYDYMVTSTDARIDHSVSQYGVLGLWALAEAGFEMKRELWGVVEDAWMLTQDKATGGWTYGLMVDPKNPPNFNMTAAGVATLFVTQDYVHANSGVEPKGNITNPAIDAGLNFLANHFDQCNSPYSYYAAERIGVASGRKYFGKVDWYKEVSDRLVQSQGGNGSWGGVPGENSDLTSTALGIVALVRGRAPIVMNKLEYDLDENGKVTEGFWNERPRDVANVTKWIGKQIERDLNWQIVNLKVSPDDLHDAPILYISGSQALNFSVETKDKLKRFIEQGGLVLANADGGRAAFAESFKKIAKELFPNYEFRELPQDHPIYTNQQFPRARWKRPVGMLGMSNGTRELILLLPQADPARVWQTQAVGAREELWFIAADIFQYAVDKQNLQFKGQTYIVKPDPKIIAKRTIKLARIQTSGTDWDPEAGGWRRLAAIMHNKLETDLVVQPVKLGSGNLAGYKVAHLTGVNPVTFSEAERKELKTFVEAGGTLIIDAAGGSPAFGQSIEAELAAIFGKDAAKQLANPLPKDNPLYAVGGQKIERVGYRSFAKKTLISGLKLPRIRGIEINGRTAIYYSAEDLSTGLVGQEVDGVHGYDPQSATELMRNMLLMATK